MAGKNWVWEKGGIYFGVSPAQLLGWLLTTFFVYCVVGWLWCSKEQETTPTTSFQALPVIGRANDLERCQERGLLAPLR